MDLKKRVLTITFSIIAIVAILFALVKPFNITKQSEEGLLMSAACDDIKSFETLAAESEIEKIIATIEHHVHLRGDNVDTLLVSMVNELTTMEDQLVFREENLGFYKEKFARILNQLSFIELQNALLYLEKENTAKAGKSIKEAQHYLHDALIFSEDDLFQEAFEILHELNNMSHDRLYEPSMKEYLKNAADQIQLLSS